MEPKPKKQRSEKIPSKNEERINILRWTCPESPRVFGVLKERYADFIVSEIRGNDISGSLASLSDISCEPISFLKEPITTSKFPSESALQEEMQQNLTKGIEILKSAGVNSDICDGICKLSEYGKIEADKESITIVDIPEKDTRTLIHCTIRVYFSGLCSDAVDVVKGEEAVKCIRVLKIVDAKKRGVDGGKKGSGRGQYDTRLDNYDPKKKYFKKYIHFTLAKENMTTNDAINIIAKTMRVSVKGIGFAGTKDKRGITFQKCSVSRILPAQLKGVNKRKQGAIRVGNLEYHESGLSLGMLGGNRFTVVLRQIEEEKDRIDEILTALRNRGFLNYFGHQRFGSGEESATHLIGLAIVKGNYEKAINLILGPKADETREDIVHARKTWVDTHDPHAALAQFPHFARIEKTILTALCKLGPTAYLNALESLPFNMQTLYVHALQGFIWNWLVSERVRLYGCEVVVGDLVSCCKNDADSGDKTVRVVRTEEEAMNTDISSVVLPLPGYDIVLPENGIKQVYEDFMAKLGLDLDCWSHSTRLRNCKGAYRNVLIKPHKLDWEHTTYSDVTVPLAVNELYKVLDEEKRNEGREEGEKAGEKEVKEEAKEQKALILSFSLPPGCYATMLLRELLIDDTSSSTQKAID